MIGGVCLIWPHSTGSWIMSVQDFEVNFISCFFGGRWCLSVFSLQLYFENNRTTTLTTLFQLENTLLYWKETSAVLYFIIYFLSWLQWHILSPILLHLHLWGLFSSLAYSQTSSWIPSRRPVEKSWQKWKMLFSLSFIENRLISYNIYSLCFALFLPSQFLPTIPCSWINHLSVSP